MIYYPDLKITLKILKITLKIYGKLIKETGGGYGIRDLGLLEAGYLGAFSNRLYREIDKP